MWSDASSSTVFLHPQQSGEDYLPLKLDQKQFDRIQIQIRDTDGEIL